MAEGENQQVFVVDSSAGLMYITFIEGSINSSEEIYVENADNTDNVQLPSNDDISISASDSPSSPSGPLTEVQCRIEALLEANKRILDNEKLLQLKSRSRGTRRNVETEASPLFLSLNLESSPQCSTLKSNVVENAVKARQNSCFSFVEAPEQEISLRSIFTWEFLDETLNREWEEGERETVENLIKEGDDEQIVNRLFGPESCRLRQCFQCLEWVQGFDHDYVTHCEVNHPEEEPAVVCEYCGIVSSTFDRYHTHWRSHLREYKCYVSNCFKIFRSRRALAMHKSKHKPRNVESSPNSMPLLPKCKEMENTVCELFNEKFKESSSMKDHMNVHKGSSKFYNCATCGKAYSSYSGLRNHELSQHDANPYNFICHVCGKRYQLKQSLLSHMSTHTDLEYSCSICGATFKMLRSYRSHEKRHREISKPATYHCDKCPKVFVTKSLLKQHTDVHALTKAYSCSACGKQYKLRKSYLAHMRTHTCRPEQQ